MILPANAASRSSVRSCDATRHHRKTDLGDLPADWSVGAIGDSRPFITSGSRGWAQYYSDIGEPFIRIGNLSHDWVDVSLDDLQHVKLDAVASVEALRTCLRRGDLLISITADIGAIGFVHDRVPLPAYINQHIALVRFDPASVYSKFAAYVLASRAVQRVFRASMDIGAKAGMSLITVRKIRMPLPPIPEQRIIATALSDVDGLIASLDRLIAKKRAIKQAAMQQLLTGKTRLPGFSGKWDTKPLRALADITMGQSPASVFYNVRGNGLPLIQGNADIENRRTIARVWTTQASKRCISGDILLTVRAPVGAVGIASENACLGRGVCGLRPQVDSSFLFQALVFAEPRWRVLEQGSTFTSANRAQVGQFEVRVPLEIAEQQAIGACLDDMDSELQSLERRAAKARAIKQGMMQALLSGRVRLPVPVETATQAVNAEATPPSSRPHNWQINEAVVIGVLAKTFGSEAYPLGRKRYTKLSYLLHRHVEKKADGYLKKAAGPYNPSTKYGGPEKIALKNGYVQEHASGQYRGFVAGDGIAQAEGYFEKWYGPEALKWLEQFRRRKNDALGVLATVDMAAQELRAAGHEVTVQTIKGVLAANKEWKPKLSQPEFSDHAITAAIEEAARLFGMPDTEGRPS